MSAIVESRKPTRIVHPILAAALGLMLWVEPASGACLTNGIECCIGDGSFETGCVTGCCESDCFTETSGVSTSCETIQGQLACATSTTCNITVTSKRLILTADTDLPANISVDLRVWEPRSGQPRRGTILFGSGLDGDHFLSEMTPVYQMMNELAEIGFRVIDRRWVGAGGWKGTDLGHRVEASRYATLVKFLHRRYRWCAGDLWNGPFIVVGHSSGATEVGYALTTYDLDPYIDLVILSSGPPEARLDKECTSNKPCDPETETEAEKWCDLLFCTYPHSGDATWVSCDNEDCEAQVDRASCVFNVDNPETYDPSCKGSCKPSTGPDFLSQNSVLWGDDSPPDTPDSPGDFPHTTVHMILGLRDASAGPVGGLSFYDRTTTRRRLSYLDLGHQWIDADNAGGRGGRKFLKHAIEYFSRPWAGDVNYDGDIDYADGEEVAAHLYETGCPVTPVPGGAVEFDRDVNNDGTVDEADLEIIVMSLLGREGCSMWGLVAPGRC